MELLRAAALELQRRPDDWSLIEAPHILLGIATLPPWVDLPRQELIQLSCRAIAKDIHDLPPIYLTKSFFGAVALDLVASEDAAQSASYPFEAALVEALSLMAYHMLLIIPRGLRVEMEMMAQLLLALAVRAPEAKLELLGFSSLIRVQQREIVRKAIQLGSGFSRCAAFAAAAVWPWREEWLQPWFLEEVRHFGEREAEAEVTAGLSDWLDAAVSAQEPTPQGAPVDARDFGVGVVPWPSAVAWYLPPCQTERNESPLLRTYGPETRVMGWELGMDSMEQDADFAQE